MWNTLSIEQHAEENRRIKRTQYTAVNFIFFSLTTSCKNTDSTGKRVHCGCTKAAPLSPSRGGLEVILGVLGYDGALTEGQAVDFCKLHASPSRYKGG